MRGRLVWFLFGKDGEELEGVEDDDVAEDAQEPRPRKQHERRDELEPHEGDDAIRRGPDRVHAQEHVVHVPGERALAEALFHPGVDLLVDQVRRVSSVAHEEERQVVPGVDAVPERADHERDRRLLAVERGPDQVLVDVYR